MNSRRSAYAILAIGCAVGLAVLASGCASVLATDDVGPGATSIRTPFPMPDLGPSPQPEPLTDERMEELRLADLEASWVLVADRYPDAIRPDPAFVGYIGKDTAVSVLRECFEANGVPIDEGRDSPDMNGPVTSIGSSVSTKEQAVGNFICHAQHPVKPMSDLSAAQRGYVYDYLTEFLVPCYESFGIVNEPAPSREFFVENWPRQNWFPSAFANELSMEVDPAVEEDCPPDE